MKESYKQKVVAFWLLAGVFMIVVQTLLGGVTRLTGSGLSITEWKPIMGTLPPQSEPEWNAAFEKYKQIGQYRLINNTFSLADFKNIFFWEWFHRLWARLLFVVFAVGFTFFFLKKYFDSAMIRPLLVLVGLGAMQGVVGWLMVTTGLNKQEVHVNYLALAVHFMAAMILACYTLWFALSLLISPKKILVYPTGNRLLVAILVVLSLQLTYGAFMAGSKAAMAAPTWPTLNGVYVPLTLLSHGWLIDSDLGSLQLNIQFIHRGLAYVLLILVMAWYYIVQRKAKEKLARTALYAAAFPLLLVLIQVDLGIMTVLESPLIAHGRLGKFEVFAEIHQLVAMFLLMALVTNLYLIRGRSTE